MATQSTPRHRYFYGRRQYPSRADPTATVERDLWWASNFAAAPFVLNGVRWPTSEHYYQAAKYADTDPAWAEEIRKATTPAVAARMGRSRSHIMTDKWDIKRNDVMLRALHAKFEQNVTLASNLRATGNDVLHEDAGVRDTYWGIGTPSKPGLSMLGHLLMEVRTHLTTTNVQ